MKLPELRAARYKGNDFEIKLINPVLEEEDGILYISCILDANGEKEEYKRLGSIFRNEDSGIIYTEESCNKTIQCSNVSMIHISTNYNDIKARFICFHRVEVNTRYLELDNNSKGSLLRSFCVEGFETRYDKMTTVSIQRIINYKEENIPIEFRKDYTEVDMRFYHNEKFYDIKFSIIEISEEELVSFRIINDAEIDKAIYFEIKPKLVGFLSLLGSNRINIREEYFVSERYQTNYIYSIEKSEKKNNSEYYPISEAQFTRKHIIHDYFKCFNRFKEIEDKLDIGHIISMLNETSNLYIDTKCFILFVALEKLSYRFINSDLCPESEMYEMDNQEFKARIKNVKKQFKEEFKGINKQSFNILNSKIGDINRKAKYGKKIDSLLDYAEINRTQKIDDVILRIRNLAIHEGEINYQNDGKAYKNYQVLDNLIRDVLSNLIHYKGIRCYGKENGKLIVKQNIEFKTEERMTYPPGITYIDYVPDRLATIW